MLKKVAFTLLIFIGIMLILAMFAYIIFQIWLSFIKPQEERASVKTEPVIGQASYQSMIESALGK